MNLPTRVEHAFLAFLELVEGLYCPTDLHFSKSGDEVKCFEARRTALLEMSHPGVLTPKRRTT